MNRERVAWMVSLAAIALLAFQLNGTLAHRDDDYAWVRTLVDVHRYVAGNYADPVDEARLRQGAIDGMLGELDPFSVYVPAERREEFDRMLEGSFKGVGVELDQDKKTMRIEVVSPIEGSPAFKAGVRAGDTILKVNGEEVAGQKLEDVIERVKGPLGSEVSLTVQHLTGEEREYQMKRQEVVLPTVKGVRRREDFSWVWYINQEPKVAYVRVTQFTADTSGDLELVLRGLIEDGMEGLILDLRANPGGRLDQAEEVVDLFLEEGTIVVTRGRARPEVVRTAKSDGTLPQFPMVVLVNEHSASAAEIVAGSLKDNNRALVIGERTYGKGSVQEVIHLDDSGELKLTVAYYYLPGGRLVHRKKDSTEWGVEPQIIVPVDPETEVEIMRQQRREEWFRPTPPEEAGGTSPEPTADDGAPAPDAPPDVTAPGENGEAEAAAEQKKAADTQLQAAVSTLVGHIVLERERAAGE